MITLVELYILAEEINTISSKPIKGKLIISWFNVAIGIETDECIIWPFGKYTTGYGQVRIDGEHNCVHIFAARKRIGPVPIGMETAHGPCNNSCFNYKHLSYKTRKENLLDRIRGERNGAAKFTDVQIKEAIDLWYNTGFTQDQIAERCGMSQSHLSGLIAGKRRRMVSGD